MVNGNEKSPRVLIAATGQCWMGTARLAMTLKELGCRLELMALNGHPARVTGAFERTYRYDPLRPMASLRRAVRESQAEFVIPADELALMHVGEMRGVGEGGLRRWWSARLAGRR